VQEALEACYFKLLNYVAVFPVEDQNKLTDHEGNVLPDVFLVPSDMNVRDFASEYIHTELGKYFLYAIDVRKKQKLGEDYILKHRDVIKIVSSK
jgi:Predicted GTPase, probable translation factor